MKTTTSVFLVYQVSCDDQLALFSLFGFDLISHDELLLVPDQAVLAVRQFAPKSCRLPGGCVRQGKEFHLKEAAAASSDRDNLFSLLDGGLGLSGRRIFVRGDGLDFLHRVHGRCFKVQRPSAVETGLSDGSGLGAAEVGAG